MAGADSRRAAISAAVGSAIASEEVRSGFACRMDNQLRLVGNTYLRESVRIVKSHFLKAIVPA